MKLYQIICLVAMVAVRLIRLVRHYLLRRTAPDLLLDRSQMKKTRNCVISLHVRGVKTKDCNQCRQALVAPPMASCMLHTANHNTNPSLYFHVPPARPARHFYSCYINRCQYSGETVVLHKIDCGHVYSSTVQSRLCRFYIL